MYVGGAVDAEDGAQQHGSPRLGVWNPVWPDSAERGPTIASLPAFIQVNVGRFDGMNGWAVRSRFGVAATLMAGLALLAGCADDGAADARADESSADAMAQDGGAEADSPTEHRPNPTRADGSTGEPGAAGGSGDSVDGGPRPSREPRGGGSGSGGGGANADIPSNPSPVRTVKPYSGGVAVFTTPSGNISCGISRDNLRCGIASYNDDAPYGEADIGGPIDTVLITGGTASMYAGSDVPPWADRAFGAGDTMQPQVVGYGESVTYENFVCLSEQDGLTCWDTDSTAGAFMSRARTDLF